MKSRPVLYDSLKTILYHMDANLRINISTRMPSVRAFEKSVSLKIIHLSFSDTTVNINDVRYDLSVYRDYPNGDFLRGEGDFDRFGFEIPFGSSPILPGDVSVRSGNELVMRTDTDGWEQYYQTELNKYENRLRIIAEKESGVTSKWDKSWNVWRREYSGLSKEQLQYMVNHFREKLKPFHCRRHNLPRSFNCYFQLSIIENGEATPLQRLAYTRKLYEAVKHFNHVLFANRPAIRVNKLVCLSDHRIPIGLKISANELIVKQSHIASIATILESDLKTIRVFMWKYTENWWQHRLVKNAKELILRAEAQNMHRSLGNKIIRFHNRLTLTSEQYCDLIENWMSVKRETGAELWIGLYYEKHRNDILEMIQARMKVIRRDDRSVRILGERGTHIELNEDVCEDESIHHRWAVKVKIIKN